MTTATPTSIEYLANNLDDLRKIAYGPQDDTAAAAAENAFGWIVDALWDLDPSDAPAGVLRTLDAMPNGMRARFDEWADREGRVLPESKGGGGTVRWVIAPDLN